MTRGSRRMLSGLRRPPAVLKSSSSPSMSIQTIVISGLLWALNVFDESQPVRFRSKSLCGDPLIGYGVSTLSHISKLRTLLSGSTRNETNKTTQCVKRTLIKVGRSSQYWFQLLTVISKMQSVLEFNDVRPVRITRLDGQYDTQPPPVRRAPSPSYADSVSRPHVDWSTALIKHVYSMLFI